METVGLNGVTPAQGKVRVKQSREGPVSVGQVLVRSGKVEPDRVKVEQVGIRW